MNERSQKVNDLRVSAFMLVFVVILSTVFYCIIEGWNLLDSVYFVTMTLTTVGYGDLVPATNVGKIFTIVLVWVGISIAFFFIYSIAAYRDSALDRHVVNRLSVLKNLATPSRSKKDSNVSKAIRKKLEED